jgi:hypothetical protein
MVGVGVTGTGVTPPEVGGTEPVGEGSNVVAAAEGVEGVVLQPDIAAEPRMTMAPQPTAVNARGVRTLLRYPVGQP